MTGFGETLAATAVKSAAGPATNALSTWGRRKFDKFLVTYTNTFSGSIEQSVAKCSTVRNVLYRNQSARTDEKYVGISFLDRDNEPFSDEKVFNTLTTRGKILLRGRGGAGKTMFTKWLVLRLAERFASIQQIPIYVELREIRDIENIPFETLVFNYITTSRSKNSYSQFIEGLSIGLFVFVFDAADEINKNDRANICKKIIQFRQTFPECGMLLTSRDFDEIDAMQGFNQYKTRSLTKNEAVSILEKLDYDEEVKGALISEIRTEKTDRHAFFLENPLMVTIMLLTYDQSKDIPNKRSAFYRRAFEALYERHDASKGIFRRDHHTGLPMDEFEKVFSTFCFGTYANGRFLIEEDQLVPLFAEACRISEIDENPASIAKDAHESACLIVKEGHDYVFCHRSFQEYFSAVYLRDYRSHDIPQMFDAALNRGQGENVIEFIYEMDKQSFEQNYVIPHLKKIIKQIAKQMRTVDDGFSIAKSILQRIDMNPLNGSFEGWSFRSDSDSKFLFNMIRIYPELNIVKTFLNLEDHKFEYWAIPMDVAKATGSYSEYFAEARRRNVVRLKFTSSAEEWFNLSELLPRIKSFWGELNALHDRLSQQYAKPSSSVAGKFSSFER